MALHTIDDLNIGAINDQLSEQAKNLGSTLRDVAQTAQSKNPLPLSKLSKHEQESAADTLKALSLVALMLVAVFFFYRAIVKSGVQAALREHHDEMHHEWAARPDTHDSEQGDKQD